MASPTRLLAAVIGPLFGLVLLLTAVTTAVLPGAPAFGCAGPRDSLRAAADEPPLMTVASVALGTATSTATDMTTGIIARFRTMDIARVSVLTGHVLGAVIKTGFAVVIVTAFAFLLGFRSDAGPLGWLGAIGLLILIACSLT